MTTDNDHEGALTRRTFAGLGIAAGAAAATGFAEVPRVLASPSVTPMTVPPTEAFGTINPALTYVQIDALAFNVFDFGESRFFTDSTGVQSTNSGHYLAAPIPIPVGSTIFQVDISYRSQPVCEIRLRDHITVTPFATPFQQTPPSSANAAQITFNLNPGITIPNRKSALFAFLSTGGSALFGVTIGYTPPTQSFIPFSGATPRVLDTRDVGGPLQPGEDRVVDLGFLGARGAVLNLTVTNTGPGGFVAVFPANVVWPGNSSINWAGPNQNVANGVITALDSAGRIKIHGGASAPMSSSTESDG
jgi:hypothetical protein